MRSTPWMLIGLLVMGGPPPSDADERKNADTPQAARFERLLKQRPHDPALHYNLGTVRYRQGRYDTAAESLSAAVASSGSSLQGRASYNLGNAHYRLGRAAEQAVPGQAVDFYHNALEEYRCAIRQDPKDADAKYNYELVDQHLKALKAQPARQQSAKTEQQQAASAESKSEPESASSTEAAHGAEPQPQGEQAQALRQQPGRQGSEHDAQAAAEPQNISQQQALWILDTLKREERGALVKEPQGPARESDVEQNW